MREIVFRGKIVGSEKWFYGLPYSSRYDDEIDQIVSIGHHEDIIPETIGQFTGLLDKNGKKVFEGDICFCNNEKYKVVIEELGGAYKVININKPEDKHFLLYVNKIVEIIGNIHE